MRIVEVNPFHYPFLGGIEHRIHHISSRLASRHEVIVLTGRLPGTPETEEMGGYTVRRLPSRYLDIYNPPHIRTPGVLEALAGLDPDIVDFHYRWSPSYNRAAARYRGAKVFTFHNTYGEGAGITRPLSILNDFLWKPKLARFPRVVCVSQFIARDLVARGLEPERLVTVPNGIELPPDREYPEGDYLLFLGRLVGTKGIPILLRAMRQVDADLVVCGGGPDLGRLERLAARLGIAHRVRFTGRVSEAEKTELLANCRLFVLPSLFESYGIAAAEAMAYGKPVVASDVGGLPEVVGDGGLLARPGDAGDLAACINRLLGDDELRRDMGRRARQLASTYTWDRAAELMEKVYQDMLAPANAH